MNTPSGAAVMNLHFPEQSSFGHVLRFPTSEYREPYALSSKSRLTLKDSPQSEHLA